MSEKWLEARSKENLILFHSAELIETRDTGCRPDVTPSAYKQLKRGGLLLTGKGHRFTLSQLCLTILSDLEESKMTANEPERAYQNSPGGQPVPVHESELISSKEVNEVE